MWQRYEYELKKPPFSCSVIGGSGMCIALPEKLKERAKAIDVFYKGKLILKLTSEGWSEAAVAHRYQGDKFGREPFLMSYFKLLE